MEDVERYQKLTKDVQVAVAAAFAGADGNLLARSIGAQKIFTIQNSKINRFEVWGQFEDKSLHKIASFGVTELPGCCGVVVFHNSIVEVAYRKHGIGRRLLEARERAGRDRGYTVLMATVRLDNKDELRLLRDAHWVSCHSFKNQRTNNEVAIYVKSFA